MVNKNRLYDLPLVSHDDIIRDDQLIEPMNIKCDPAFGDSDWSFRDEIDDLSNDSMNNLAVTAAATNPTPTKSERTEENIERDQRAIKTEDKVVSKSAGNKNLKKNAQKSSSKYVELFFDIIKARNHIKHFFSLFIIAFLQK